MMVGIVMLYILAAIFIVIGIYITRQEQPVFFRPENPIKVDNIKKFNRAHGTLYILFSIPFAVTAMLLMAEQELAATVILTTNFTVGLILLAKGYQRITVNQYAEGADGLHKASIS